MSCRPRWPATSNAARARPTQGTLLALAVVVACCPAGLVRRTMVARQPTAHRGTSSNAGRALLLALVVLLVAGLAGCGARSDRWTVEGHLVAGDGDIWLVDAMPI